MRIIVRMMNVEKIIYEYRRRIEQKRNEELRQELLAEALEEELPVYGFAVPLRRKERELVGSH